MDTKQFREYVIRPTLKQLDLYSASAENLLAGTAAQESRFKYLKQIGGGPAIGVYQMEPATHRDIWKNYLSFKPELHDKIMLIAGHQYSLKGEVNPFEMAGNHFYATAMARIHYLRVPSALPQHDDIEGLANYWKAHYNTMLGKGTPEEFIENYPHE